MFLKILVLLDGSPDAQEALSQAIDLAESEHSQLTVLTAIGAPTHLTALGGVDALAIQGAQTEATAVSEWSRTTDTSSDPSVLCSDEPSHHSMFEWQIRERSP